eukprot:scaffold650781_cov51-Prasinocladus_malaysianus.AAC.1
MSGWTHDDVKDGMTYESVQHPDGDSEDTLRKEKYFGETGAQSSVLPALDAALGVAMLEDELTPYLKAMRE